MDKFTITRHSRVSLNLSQVMAALLACVSVGALAHGYVKSPESRSYACNQGNNLNCGAVQWEPQSVEGVSGFPETGPADGKLASAANAAFSALDEQSPSRWSKTPMVSGWQDFTWQFTANHVTRNWRYYLTRQDWDSTAPLTRDSFDLSPFCVIDGNMVQPPKLMSHQCYVPEGRSGYQVILAVWEIGDTDNSFYNMIDVQFDGASVPSEWSDVGNINPSMDLNAGDKVMTRVFTANGEQVAQQTSVTIADAEQGLKDNWPYVLASAINASQSDIQAGQKNAAGDIAPVYGKNEIYARSGSGVERVEIGFEIAPAEGNSVTVSGLADSYAIEQGQANVSFDVTTTGELTVSAYLFNHDGAAAGFSQQTVNNTSANFVVAVTDPMAGHYHLQVKAQAADDEVFQQNYDLFLSAPSTTPDADFVFPEGIGAYQAGTRVLQPKDGKVYQCKPWPYSGYCQQWSATATGFEPGVGADWSMAWTAL